MTAVTPQTATSHRLLERIAEHERSLLRDIDQARGEAQAQVDRARTESRVFREQDERALSEEVLTFRREAEAARAADYDQTVREAHTKAERDRAHVQQQTAAVAREVLAMILPKGTS